MDTKLSIPINCGEKTCYSEFKSPCRYLMVERMGTSFFCKIFSNQCGRTHTPLEEDECGRIQRHIDCMEFSK
jgi:hypothetical protein